MLASKYVSWKTASRVSATLSRLRDSCRRSSSDVPGDVRPLFGGRQLHWYRSDLRSGLFAQLRIKQITQRIIEHIGDVADLNKRDRAVEAVFHRLDFRRIAGDGDEIERSDLFTFDHDQGLRPKLDGDRRNEKASARSRAW